MNYEDAKRRYMTDATFYNAVNTMVRWIESLHMAPGELRQAAVFAEIVHRERTQLPKPPREDEAGE